MAPKQNQKKEEPIWRRKPVPPVDGALQAPQAAQPPVPVPDPPPSSPAVTGSSSAHRNQPPPSGTQHRSQQGHSGRSPRGSSRGGRSFHPYIKRSRSRTPTAAGRRCSEAAGRRRIAAPPSGPADRPPRSAAFIAGGHRFLIGRPKPAVADVSLSGNTAAGQHGPLLPPTPLARSRNPRNTTGQLRLTTPLAAPCPSAQSRAASTTTAQQQKQLTGKLTSRDPKRLHTRRRKMRPLQGRGCLTG